MDIFSKHTKLNRITNLDMFHVMTQSFEGTNLSQKNIESDNFDSDDELRSKSENEGKKKGIPNLSNKKSHKKRNSRLYTCNQKVWAFRKDKKTIRIGTMSGIEVVDIDETILGIGREITSIYLAPDQNLLWVGLDNKNAVILSVVLNDLFIKLPRHLGKFWEHKVSEDKKNKGKIDATVKRFNLPDSSDTQDLGDSLLSFEKIKGEVSEKSRISNVVWSSLKKTFFYSLEKEIKEIKFKPKFLFDSEQKAGFEVKSLCTGKNLIRHFDVCQLSGLIFFVDQKNQVSCVNQRGRVLKTRSGMGDVVKIAIVSKENEVEKQDHTIQKWEIKSLKKSFDFPDTHTERTENNKLNKKNTQILNNYALEYIVLLLNSKDVLILNVSDFIMKEATWSFEPQPIGRFILESMQKANSQLQEKLKSLIIDDPLNKPGNHTWKEIVSFVSDQKGSHKNVYSKEMNSFIQNTYQGYMKKKNERLLFREKLWDQIETYTHQGDIFIVFLRVRLLLRLSLNFPLLIDGRLKENQSILKKKEIYNLLGQNLYNVIVSPVDTLQLYRIALRKPETIKQVSEITKIEQKPEVKKKRTKARKNKEKRIQYNKFRDDFISKNVLDDMLLKNDYKDINWKVRLSGFAELLLALQARYDFSFDHSCLDIIVHPNDQCKTLSYWSKGRSPKKTKPKGTKNLDLPNWKIITTIWNDCVKFYLVDLTMIDRFNPPDTQLLVNHPRQILANLRWRFISQVQYLCGHFAKQEDTEPHVEVYYYTLKHKSVVICDGKEGLKNMTRKEMYESLKKGIEFRTRMTINLGELRIYKNNLMEFIPGKLFTCNLINKKYPNARVSYKSPFADKGFMYRLIEYDHFDVDKVTDFVRDQFSQCYYKTKIRIYNEVGFDIKDKDKYAKVIQYENDSVKRFYYFCQFFRAKIQNDKDYNFDYLSADVTVFGSFLEKNQPPNMMEFIQNASGETLSELLMDESETHKKSFAMRMMNFKTTPGTEEEEKQKQEQKKEIEACAEVLGLDKEMATGKEIINLDEVQKEKLISSVKQMIKANKKDFGKGEQLEFKKKNKSKKRELIMPKKSRRRLTNSKKKSTSGEQVKEKEKVRIEGEANDNITIEESILEFESITDSSLDEWGIKQTEFDKKEEKPQIPKTKIKSETNNSSKKEAIKESLNTIIEKNCTEEFPVPKKIKLGQEIDILEIYESHMMNPKKLQKERKRIMKELKKPDCQHLSILNIFLDGKQVMIDLIEPIPSHVFPNSDFDSDPSQTREYNIEFISLDLPENNPKLLSESDLFDLIPLPKFYIPGFNVTTIPTIINLAKLYTDDMFPMSLNALLHFALRRTNQMDFHISEYSMLRQAQRDITQIVVDLYCCKSENGFKIFYHHPNSPWMSKKTHFNRKERKMYSRMPNYKIKKQDVGKIQSINATDESRDLGLDAYYELKKHYKVEIEESFENIHITKLTKDEYLKKFKEALIFEFYKEFLKVTTSTSFKASKSAKIMGKKNRVKRFKKLVKSIGIKNDHLLKTLVSLFARDNASGVFDTLSAESLKADFKNVEKLFLQKYKKLDVNKIAIVKLPKNVKKIMELDCEESIMVYQIGTDNEEDRVQKVSKNGEEYLVGIRGDVGVVKRILNQCKANLSKKHFSCIHCKEKYNAIELNVNSYGSLSIDTVSLKLIHQLDFKKVKELYEIHSKKESLDFLNKEVKIEVNRHRKMEMSCVFDRFINIEPDQENKFENPLLKSFLNVRMDRKYSDEKIDFDSKYKDEAKQRVLIKLRMHESEKKVEESKSEKEDLKKKNKLENIDNKIPKERENCELSEKKAIEKADDKKVEFNTITVKRNKKFDLNDLSPVKRTQTQKINKSQIKESDIEKNIKEKNTTVDQTFSEIDFKHIENEMKKVNLNMFHQKISMKRQPSKLWDEVNIMYNELGKIMKKKSVKIKKKNSEKVFKPSTQNDIDQKSKEKIIPDIKTNKNNQINQDTFTKPTFEAIKEKSEIILDDSKNATNTKEIIPQQINEKKEVNVNTIKEAQKYIFAKNEKEKPKQILLKSELKLDSREEQGNKMIQNLINGRFFNKLISIKDDKDYTLKYNKVIEIEIFQKKDLGRKMPKKINLPDFCTFWDFGEEIRQERRVIQNFKMPVNKNRLVNSSRLPKVFKAELDQFKKEMVSNLKKEFEKVQDLIEKEKKINLEYKSRLYLYKHN